MEELHDPTLPGWEFQLREGPMGVYCVDGRHTDGRSVSRAGGLDPDELLRECKNDARTLPPRRSVPRSFNTV
jgi:hypothetical protein